MIASSPKKISQSLSRRLKLFVSISPLFFFSQCGSDTSFTVWTDTVLGALGGAILATQNIGILDRIDTRAAAAFPKSAVECPTYNDSDASRSDCLNHTVASITGDPGQSLRRRFQFCQFSSSKNPAWWLAYYVVKFPDLATCQSVKGSASGLTAANITAFNLVGKDVTITYGLGEGGDQQTFRFAQNGEVLRLYSDFKSGWADVKTGGTVVTFTSATERKIFISGVHAQIYQTLYGNTRNPNDIWADLQTKSQSEVLTLYWDRTLSSQLAGERLYQTNAVASDTLATTNSQVLVQMVGGVPTARAGAIVRTQDQQRHSLGISTITGDLKFADPACCWPSEGELTTDFIPFFNTPSSGGKAFLKEILQFAAGGACGAVTVVQSGGDLGAKGKTTNTQLYHCL